METFALSISLAGVAMMLATINYRYGPLAIAGAALLGLLPLPASLAWVGNAPGLVAGGTWLTGALLLDRMGGLGVMGKGPRIAVRSAGIPLAVAAVLAAVLGVAARDGIDGHLLKGGADAGSILETRQYAFADIFILVVGVVAATFGVVIGKLQRLAIRGARAVADTLGVPGFRLVQGAAPVLSLLTGALVAHMPMPARLAILGVTVVIGAILLIALRRRVTEFRLLWRAGDAARRAAATVEVAVPGSGALFMRQYVRGVSRIVLAATTVFFVMAAAGLLALPIYLWLGLGGGISILHSAHPGTRPAPGRAAVFDEPRPATEGWERFGPGSAAAIEGDESHTSPAPEADRVQWRRSQHVIEADTPMWDW
jgi:hypothetical protein